MAATEEEDAWFRGMLAREMAALPDADDDDSNDEGVGVGSMFQQLSVTLHHEEV